MKYIGRAPSFNQDRALGVSDYLRDGTFKVEYRNDGATSGPAVVMDRFSASPAVSDFLAALQWAGRSSTGVERTYAEILSQVLDPVNATEDAELIFRTMKAGTKTDVGYMAQGQVLGAPTGGDQGTGTLNATGVYVNGVALNAATLNFADYLFLTLRCI